MAPFASVFGARSARSVIVIAGPAKKDRERPSQPRHASRGKISSGRRETLLSAPTNQRQERSEVSVGDAAPRYSPPGTETPSSSSDSGHSTEIRGVVHAFISGPRTLRIGSISVLLFQSFRNPFRPGKADRLRFHLPGEWSMNATDFILAAGYCEKSDAGPSNP